MDMVAPVDAEVTGVGRRRLIGWAVAGCIAACATAGPAAAVLVTPFSMNPANGAVHSIAAGPDGNVWYEDATHSTVGLVTPAGRITDLANGAGVPNGSQPWDIAAGPDGRLWFPERAGRKIGAMNPATRSAVEYTLPDIPNHSRTPVGVTGGPDGNVWVVEDEGRIDRITPTGTVATFPITKSPYRITTGADGDLWFTFSNELQGDPFHGGIGRITPSGTVDYFTQGITGQPWGITPGPDGSVWFAEDYAGGRIGRITPQGQVTEVADPGSTPAWITTGPDGNLYVGEVAAQDRLLRITPSGAITVVNVPLPGSGFDGPVTAGPGRQLWMATASGFISRIRLAPGATTGDPASAPGSVTATGSVDPYASLTSFQFQYGTTTAYGQATAAVVVPPGPGPRTVSAPLNGLKPDTLYHYRLVATSEAGTTPGADHVLATFGLALPAPGAGGGTDRRGPRVTLAATRLSLTRAGRITLRLRCPLTETLGCRGTVRLATAARVPVVVRHHTRKRVLALGSAAFRIAGGATTTVTVRVPPAGRRLIAAKGAIRARVTVAARDLSGNKATTSRVVTLRAPAQRG